MYSTDLCTVSGKESLVPSFCSLIMYTESLTSVCIESANSTVEMGQKLWFTLCLGNIKTSESKRHFWRTSVLPWQLWYTGLLWLTAQNISETAVKQSSIKSPLIMKGKNRLVSAENAMWKRFAFKYDFFLQERHENQKQSTKLHHLILKRDSKQKWVSFFLLSRAWSLDVAVILELQMEPCDSGFHFTVFSELFSWALGWSWLFSVPEVFTCWGSHFPSFTVFKQTPPDAMSGLGEYPVEIAHTGQEQPLSWCCRCCCQAQHAGSMSPLQAEAVRAILENINVTREPSSYQLFPGAIPMFQGAILQQNLYPP